MGWRKRIVGTTSWQDSAGTSETLSATLPKAVQRQRSSVTSWTMCWSFCTKDAMEVMLSDTTAMMQAMESLPRVRWSLFHVEQEKDELFEVWLVVDKCPPSSAPEQELERGPRGRSPTVASSACAESVTSSGTLPQTELWPQDAEEA